jgi:hypothetical protein
MLFSRRAMDGTRLVETLKCVICEYRTRKGSGSLVESWWMVALAPDATESRTASGPVGAVDVA